MGYKKGCIAGWHLISQHGTKSRAAPSYFSANLQGKNPGALRNAQRLLLKDSVAFCVIFDIELMNFLLICNAHLLLALCSAPSSRHAALCRKPSQDLPELQTFWSHLPQKSAFLASALLISSRCCQIWTSQCSPWQANDAQVCFWDCFSWWILCARSDWGYLKGHSDKECLGKSHPLDPLYFWKQFWWKSSKPCKNGFSNEIANGRWIFKWKAISATICQGKPRTWRLPAWQPLSWDAALQRKLLSETSSKLPKISLELLPEKRNQHRPMWFCNQPKQ